LIGWLADPTLRRGCLGSVTGMPEHGGRSRVRDADHELRPRDQQRQPRLVAWFGRYRNELGMRRSDVLVDKTLPLRPAAFLPDGEGGRPHRMHLPVGHLVHPRDVLDHGVHVVYDMVGLAWVKAEAAHPTATRPHEGRRQRLVVVHPGLIADDSEKVSAPQHPRVADGATEVARRRRDVGTDASMLVSGRITRSRDAHPTNGCRTRDPDEPE
jgi:hypothetical protein